MSMRRIFKFSLPTLVLLLFDGPKLFVDVKKGGNSKLKC